MLTHPATDRMKWAISRTFWWKGMGKQIEEFVKGCAICMRTKTPLKANMGILGQYQLSDNLFEFLHVDFVGPLPEAGPLKYKYVLTVIDRASNFIFAIPCPDATADTTVKMLFDRVFSIIGLPRAICSDRGPAFIADTTHIFSKATWFCLEESYSV